MAISILAEYPTQVGAATPDYPQGVPRNVSVSGANDGTPWEQLLLRDIQGFLQGLLAQVPAGPVAVSGVPDTVLVSQYIDSMKLIVQGLEITTFEAAETDTSLRMAPDGTGNTQWLAVVAEELATAELDTSLVLTPDGLGGASFNTIPGSGIVNTLTSTQIVASVPLQNYMELPIVVTGVYMVQVFSGGIGTLLCHIDNNTIVRQTANDNNTVAPTDFNIVGTNIRWGGGALANIVDGVMYLTRVS